MFGRGWLLFAAVGLAPPVTPASDNGAQAKQADDNQQKANGVPTVARSPSEAIEGAERKEIERPCDPSKDDRGSDLCAQWKAADAATSAAFWAKWSFLLGIVGTVGLFWTLFYTRQAVNAAKAATEDADTALGIAARNAEAAEAALADSRVNSALTIRAYVHAAEVAFADMPNANDPRILEIPWTNYGQTPALKTGLVTSVRYVQPGQEIADAFADVPAIEREPGRSIAQGRHTIGYTDPIPTPTLFAASQGHFRIIVLSRIEYSDAVSVADHVSQECWEIRVVSMGMPDAQGDVMTSYTLVHIPGFYIAT